MMSLFEVVLVTENDSVTVNKYIDYCSLIIEYFVDAKLQ